MKPLHKLHVVAFSLLVISCAANVDRTKETSLAQYTENEIRGKLTPQVTTRRDALIAFGVPEYPADYNNGNKWYYHSEKLDRRIYFLIPFINDRNQNLTLHFSDKGILTDYTYTDK
jgi:outer membrane protein assembly factor BamE (lipoprotein component of BamABCDE complex)